jgi:MHS family shikimate/dehydroshikimate transporter-like MFS transporter
MRASQASGVTTGGGNELQVQRRRALISAFFGGAVEYYDFFLYSLLAAVVIGPLFFPESDPAVGLIASFTTLAVAYFARPLGALFMSAIGDRLGRRVTLLWSVGIMGGATVLVGILPTYSIIGIWAPVLLVVLRIVQGLAAGAEYGGGLLMAVEYSDTGKRGLAAGAPLSGIYSGIILANFVLMLSTLMSPADFLAWGWRLPFIVSALLLALTLWLRSRVEETPVFVEAKRTSQLSNRPLRDLFRTQWRILAAMIAVIFTITTTAGATLAFFPAYARSFNFSTTESLAISLVGVVLGLVMMPFFGHLSDRVGRKRLTILGLVAIPFAMWAALALISTGFFPAALAGVVLTWIAHSIAYAPAAAWLAEQFPTRFRFSGVSVAFQLACIGTGIFPLVASSLLTASGGPSHFGWIVVYMAALAVISIVVAFFLPETSKATFAKLDEEVDLITTPGSQTAYPAPSKSES